MSMKEKIETLYSLREKLQTLTAAEAPALRQRAEDVAKGINIAEEGFYEIAFEVILGRTAIRETGLLNKEGAHSPSGPLSEHEYWALCGAFIAVCDSLCRAQMVSFEDFIKTSVPDLEMGWLMALCSIRSKDEELNVDMLSCLNIISHNTQLTYIMWDGFVQACNDLGNGNENDFCSSVERSCDRIIAYNILGLKSQEIRSLSVERATEYIAALDYTSVPDNVSEPFSNSLKKLAANLSIPRLQIKMKEGCVDRFEFVLQQQSNLAVIDHLRAARKSWTTLTFQERKNALTYFSKLINEAIPCLAPPSVVIDQRIFNKDIKLSWDGQYDYYSSNKDAAPELKNQISIWIDTNHDGSLEPYKTFHSYCKDIAHETLHAFDTQWAYADCMKHGNVPQEIPVFQTKAREARDSNLELDLVYKLLEIFQVGGRRIRRIKTELSGSDYRNYPTEKWVNTYDYMFARLINGKFVKEEVENGRDLYAEALNAFSLMKDFYAFYDAVKDNSQAARFPKHLIIECVKILSLNSENALLSANDLETNKNILPFLNELIRNLPDTVKKNVDEEYMLIRFMGHYFDQLVREANSCVILIERDATTAEKPDDACPRSQNLRHKLINWIKELTPVLSDISDDLNSYAYIMKYSGNFVDSMGVIHAHCKPLDDPTQYPFLFNSPMNLEH